MKHTMPAPHPNPPPQAGEGTNDRSANISLLLADENATCALATRIAAKLHPGMVIYLHGDLGAGKTSLVRGILNALGYTGRVKSPTYTLLEPYRVAGLNLKHFDLYRLQDEHEWESAGFRDEFDGQNILFIEWPEKAQSFIPPADIVVDLEILTSGRCATLKGNTSLGRACLKQL
ncbi:MAG: tRNA (adenosine(37)-N6)-threonylcarbamoyltransferase complex ATPase subunit type 1 TsaE [Gallionella sp.]|jgi:tRNA threonylcarbamoyladenosine biosynthesis protein TsaE